MLPRTSPSTIWRHSESNSNVCDSVLHCIVRLVFMENTGHWHILMDSLANPEVGFRQFELCAGLQCTQCLSSLSNGLLYICNLLTWTGRLHVTWCKYRLCEETVKSQAPLVLHYVHILGCVHFTFFHCVHCTECSVSQIHLDRNALMTCVQNSAQLAVTPVAICMLPDCHWWKWHHKERWIRYTGWINRWRAGLAKINGDWNPSIKWSNCQVTPFSCISVKMWLHCITESNTKKNIE